MSRLIWKFQLDKHAIGEVQTLIAPPESQVLSCADQNNELVMWVMLDPVHKDFSDGETREVIVAFTGMRFPLPSGFDFVSSVQMEGLVYHIFTRVRMLLAKNDVERSSKSMTAVCDIKPPAKNWKAKDAQIKNLNTWGEVQHFTPWN